MKYKLIYGLLIFCVILAGSSSKACDDLLRVNFPRDCKIQDRYTRVRDELLKKYTISISEIVEYKALRFASRDSWNFAKKNNLAPKNMLLPAPITWNVWEQGLNQIFSPVSSGSKIFRARDFTPELLSHIDTILLTNGTDNLKDPESDPSMAPGDIRGEGNNSVSFCDSDQLNFSDLNDKIQASQRVFKLKWEARMGSTFEQVLKKDGLQSMNIISFGGAVRPMGPGCDKDGSGYLVSYVRSDQVTDHIRQLKAFIGASFDSYSISHPAASPIEFAAFVQKWLVTIHPFADGNGRTSRAIQDLILADFNLPFAPTGDLQNDVLSPHDAYVELNYQKTEAMLTMLEGCLAERRANQPSSFSCKTVQELNRSK